MNEYYNDLVLMVFDHEIKEGKKVSGKLSDKEKVKLNNGDASEIRKKEEQLNKMGEEKKRQETEVKRREEDIRNKEFEMKKKEIGILRKKEEKKKLEEIQKLESLREEESKKIQEEFAMRQRLLQEQHAKEIKMLKQREKEVDVLQKHTSSSKEVQTENISTENKIKKLQELYLKKLTQQQIDQSRLAGEQEKLFKNLRHIDNPHILDRNKSNSCDKNQEVIVETYEQQSDMCEVDVEEPNKNITTETYMRNVFSNTDDPRRSILKYRNKGNQTDFSIQKEGRNISSYLPNIERGNVRSKRQIFLEKSTAKQNTQNEPSEHVGEWIKSMSTSEENRHFKDAMTQTNETRPFNMVNAMSESALFNYMASKTHSRRHSDDIYSQPERPNFKNTSLPLPTPSRNNNAEGWKMYMPTTSFKDESLDNKNTQNIVLDHFVEEKKKHQSRSLSRIKNIDYQNYNTTEVTIDRGTPISTLKISAPMYSPLIINVPDVISLSKGNPSTHNSIYFDQKGPNPLVVPEMKLKSRYTKYHTNSTLRDSLIKKDQYQRYYDNRNSSSHNISRINQTSKSNRKEDFKYEEEHTITEVTEEGSNSENSFESKTEGQDEHELTACANNQHSPNTNDEKTYFIPEQHSRPAPRRISHLKTMDS